jgi:hypothetical protein
MGNAMLKTETPEDIDRLKQIAEAAHVYVSLVKGPSDGPGYAHQMDQIQAFNRLAELVQEGKAE